MEPMFWLIIVPSVVVMLWIPFAAWTLFTNKHTKPGGGRAVSDSEYERSLKDSADWENVNPWGSRDGSPSRRKRKQKRSGPPSGPPRRPGPPRPARAPPLNPAMHARGEWLDDGYEWLARPNGSDVWWWRDTETGRWLRI